MLKTDVANYELWQAVYNWIVFLGQMVLIVIGIVLLYYLYRYLRALRKRLKAVKLLKTTAKRAGFKCTKTNASHLSFNAHNMETCYVLTKGLIQYNVRFLATFGKNRTLRFLRPDAYVSEKEFGYTLAVSKNHMITTILARAFKPKNMSDSLLQITHTETVTFPSNTIYTKGVEVLQEGNVHEIVILNPVPLKVFLLDKTTWKLVIGGETWQKLSFHDISSFCSMIERS